jgi:hypothetical protein
LAATPASASSAAADDDEEILLLTLPETFVYKLGARAGASGYTALSWGLDKPLLTGYLRVVAHGDAEVSLAVWQRPDQLLPHEAQPQPAGAAAAAAAASAISTAPGAAGHKLVAVCRIPLRPRAAAAAAARGGASPQQALLPQPLSFYLEPTLDSSRYFALRVSGGDGRSAVLGVGFRDRQASFDLRGAIDDVLQRVARSWGLASPAPQPLGDGDGAAAAAAAEALAAALPAGGGGVQIGPLAPAAAPAAPPPRLAAPRGFAPQAGGGDEWGAFVTQS